MTKRTRQYYPDCTAASLNPAPWKMKENEDSAI